MNVLKSIKKNDVIILLFLFAAAIIIAAAISLQNMNGDVYAEIIYNGNIILAVDLSTDRTFSVPELPQIAFEIKNGKVAFTESDCPDKICVKTGFISKHGQTAACLPNKTVLRIERREINDIDAMIK